MGEEGDFEGMDEMGEEEETRRRRKAHSELTAVVSPQMAKKLEEAGVTTLEALARMSAKELMTLTGRDFNWAYDVLRRARERIGLLRIRTADEVLNERRNIVRFTTGSKALDNLFGGGIEVGAITEFVGEFGSGKTQVCHTVATLAVANGVTVAWVDTEGTFRPERIIEIAVNRGLLSSDDTAAQNAFLSRILYGRALTSEHQMMIVDEFIKMKEKGTDIGVLIVDSLMAHFRSEYPGRENLAERQQKLNVHMAQLHKLASMNVAAIITNHVMARPDTFFGNPLNPVGGNVVAHGATYRVWLRKSKDNLRVAKIFDSPYHPEAEVVFKITEKGIEDASPGEGD